MVMASLSNHEWTYVTASRGRGIREIKRYYYNGIDNKSTIEEEDFLDGVENIG